MTHSPPAHPELVEGLYTDEAKQAGLRQAQPERD